MTSVIELRDVAKTYRGAAEDIVALAGVTFGIDAGEVVALVGPSGSGKTTLINILIGWDRPDDGECVIAEAATSGWSGTAVVPQDLGLLDELTLRENLTLPVVLGNAAFHDVEDLLVDLGLAGVADQVPTATSLGEQQRAAIGRALVTGPRLLVADEPTSHQDERNAMRIAALLRDAARDGGAVLIATHDERVVEFADTVVAIRDGIITRP